MTTNLTAQNVYHGQSFNLPISFDTFTNTNSNQLAYDYTVTQAGTVITPPSWLTFDATNVTFSGTPSISEVGEDFNVTVTANDGTNFANNTFALTVLNHAPEAQKIDDANATEGQAFSLDIKTAFTDADTDPLTYEYTVTQADGTVITLDWLKFNADTGTFSGTPAIGDAANLSIKVTATDGVDTAYSTFALAVAADRAPEIKQIADKNITEGQLFSLDIKTAFTDKDVNDALTYSATLADGSDLPTWLKFDPTNGTFSGTPTFDDVNNLSVKVTATDKSSVLTDNVFALSVAAKPLTIEQGTTNVWQTSGSGNLSVSLDSKNTTTTQLTEIGIFKVDADNKINGLAAGEDGFVKAALESGSVVFTALPDRMTTDGLDLSHSFQLTNSSDRYGFFVISDGSVEDDLNSGNFSNVITSLDPVNLDVGSPLEVINQNQGGFALNWKQGDQNLSVIFHADNTPKSSLDTISKLQGQKEGEVLDLRAFTGQNVQATFTVKRDAGYTDCVSFYKIDDADGTITGSDGKQVHPWDTGYVEAALANAISTLNLIGKNGEKVSDDRVLQGGSLYAPILMSDVSDLNPTGEHVFTAFSLGNGDSTNHVRLLGNNTFGFEDMMGGGDKDFNDVIVQASFKVVR
jgi:hypothetical protein